MKIHPRPGTYLVGFLFLALVGAFDKIFKTTILFDHTIIVIIIGCVIGFFAYDYFYDRYYEDDGQDEES